MIQKGEREETIIRIDENELNQQNLFNKLMKSIIQKICIQP